MKKQLYRIVTGILAVAWMCLIFSFSSQPATESSKVSGGLCHRLVERANDTLHLDMTEKQQLAMAEKIEYPGKKSSPYDRVCHIRSAFFCILPRNPEKRKATVSCGAAHGGSLCGYR